MKLSHKRLLDLEELEDNIGYKFNNKELLNFAFIHSSYCLAVVSSNISPSNITPS